MVSNDRQSGNRNAIVAGLMHGVRLIAIEAIAAQIHQGLGAGMQREHNSDESHLS
jgi:hypothetical protein